MSAPVAAGHTWENRLIGLRSAALVRRLGLGDERVERFADGSLPVYAVGERHVLKLYPPIALEGYDVEHAVLSAVEGRLPTPTPRVADAGPPDWDGFMRTQREACVAHMDEELSRRLLAYALLHRYSSLAWYLTRLPAPPRPTLDSLATHWWAP